MVIAVFIVMLASLNLAPRADFKSVQQKPLAEATIGKFLIQHKAALKYAQAKIKDQKNGGTVTFAPGENELTICNASGEGNLCGYFPVGYKYNQNEFYSKVYCLNSNRYHVNDDGSRTRTKVAGKDPANCTDAGNVQRYLITFGRVPERWKNVSTNKILGDFFLALKSQVPVGSSCGIVNKRQGDVDDKTNPLESEYIIQGNNVNNASIPEYFLEYDDDFTNNCDKEMSMDHPCLIEISNL